MKKWSLLILAGLCAHTGAAQIENLQTLQGQILKEQAIAKQLSEKAYLLGKDFTEGYIAYEGTKQRMNGLFMRLNMVTGDMEVNMENGDILLLNPTGIHRVGLQRQRPGVFGKEFVHAGGMWLEELSQKARIYKGYRARTVSDVQPGFNTSEVATRLVVTETHYRMSETGLAEITLKKKDVIKQLQHPNASLAFAKSKGLNLREEKGLVQLIEYDLSLN